MMKGLVPISDTLKQAEATTSPEVSKYWEETNKDLGRDRPWSRHGQGTAQSRRKT